MRTLRRWLNRVVWAIRLAGDLYDVVKYAQDHRAEIAQDMDEAWADLRNTSLFIANRLKRHYNDSGLVEIVQKVLRKQGGPTW